MPTVAYARPVEWNRVLMWGILTAVAMSFVSAIGMVVALDQRMIIETLLSLGYLALLWIPVALGYVAPGDDLPGGIRGRPRGAKDLLVGVVTGLIGGAGFALFIALTEGFDLRGVFPNLSPHLVELLTFGRGLGAGAAIWIATTGVLGLVGGLLRTVPARVRTAALGVVVWIVAIAIFEVAVSDILESLRLDSLIGLIYAKNGGLTQGSSLVIAVGAAMLGYRFHGGMKRSRTRYADLDPRRRRTVNIAGMVVGLVLLIVLPMILGRLTNELLANVGLFLLMGFGLNIVVGEAGLLDLGYVAFFAVGAYTTAVLTSPLSPRWAPQLTLNFLSLDGWIIVAAVMAVAAVAGLFVGTPVIRMRGDYLAIVTLGFGEIVRILFLSDWLSPTFGGAQGIRTIPSATLGPVEIKGTNPQAILYLVSVFVLLAVYISWRLRGSRIGRAWSATREDEDVAETMGVNTTTSKLLAFMMGATLAAFSGMIFAVKVGSVFPNSFRLLVSIIILVIVIVGGMRSIPGVLVGSLALVGILGGPTTPGLLQEFKEFKLLIYGALLVFMMLKRPEGLWPSSRRQRELHEEEVLQDAWLTAHAGEPATTSGEGEA